MQAQLSAIAYVSLALCAAYFLTRTTTSERWYRSGFAFWLGSVAVMFSLQGLKGFSLIALAALLLFLKPRPPEEKLPFLMLVFVAVPVAITTEIPFPGINYLLRADFQILIGMLAVAPALLSGPRPDRAGSPLTGWSTLFMCAYFVLTTLLMLRVLPLTAGLRFGAEALLGTLLIYLFILRYAVSQKVLEQSLAALYVTAVILACIAVMTQVKHWNFYSLVDTDVRIFKAGEVRYGLLRTGATVNYALLGLMETIGFVLLLRHRDISGHFPRYGWLIGLLLTTGLAVSLSRGAWLAGLVAFLAYFMLKSRLSSSIIAILGITCAAAVAFVVFAGDGFSDSLDPFQTFNYRKQLFAASWEQFLSAPFLGNPFYLESGRFDDLVQGEGIIDIVSVYLQIVLQFGVAGLTLFMMPFLIALGGILRARSRDLSLQSRSLVAALGAFVLGYLTLILTVSDVSLITDFGVILAALAASAVAGVNSRPKHHEQSLPLQHDSPKRF